MNKAKRFLTVPDEFNASTNLHVTGQPSPPAIINITDIAAAFFTPGHQGDTHSTLVRADGTSNVLFYGPEAEEDNDDYYSEDYTKGKAAHRALIHKIEEQTGQHLVEIAEPGAGNAEKIINANPAHAQGFQFLDGSFSKLLLFMKGMREREVEDSLVKQTVMTDIAANLPDAQTIKFQTSNLGRDDSDSTLVVSKSAVKAIWQTFDAVFMWLDGLKEPARIYGLDGDNQETTDRVVDAIVNASEGALRGVHIDNDRGRGASFFARPENIASAKQDGKSLKIQFAGTSGFDAASYREPRFYIGENIATVARTLGIALG